MCLGGIWFDSIKRPKENPMSMSNRVSLLVAGNIPANQECPFKDKCSLASSCKHKGKDHPCDYSCAMARLFDSSKR